MPSRRSPPCDRPSARLPPEDAAVRDALRGAARGLLYPSETDAPFAWFRRAMPARWPADAAVRRLARAGADAPVTESTLDETFSRVVEQVDPADAMARALRPRFAALKRTLPERLREVRVFRVGAGPRVRIYITGVAPSGALAGLRTEVVET